MLLFEVAAGYASLLAGLTLGEDTFTTQDGVIDEDSYLPSKNNGPVVNTWFEGLKVYPVNTFFSLFFLLCFLPLSIVIDHVL